ncbi:MAG: RNB domain-containing ribonuclease [Treponema sp.]|jgi:exoribonuclease-2|nr:RNB domain-containing ribonuclease [Treponema sp.]
MMKNEKGLVIYKNRPALITGFEAEKIAIAVPGGGAFKVREKDIEIIHPGPCTLKDLEGPRPEGSGREAWDLLTDESGGSTGLSLKELAELVYGDFSPGAALAVWELLRDGLYFTGDIRSIRARPRAAVAEDERKRDEKQREDGDRAALLEKLKKLPPFHGTPFRGTASPAAVELSAADRRFLQDVEALARGQSDKSRTMKELGKSETPEEAHRLLLACGGWTVWENPHPERFGLSRDSAKIIPPTPPEEDRLDLTGMAAYAIDNSWSDDPDDAVSLERPGADGKFADGKLSDGCCCLWVHVADPAASIPPGSQADMEARGRGATLYLPEGPLRMIAQEALSLFALGLSDVSPALSFKILIKPDGDIGATEIFPSLVRVTRLTYEEADALTDGKTGADIAALFALAEANVERRLNTGAVIIDLPDAHIHVNLDGSCEKDRISIKPLPSYHSAEMVRECMLLAGEGAARWALQNQVPFPFISQEAGELPEKRLPGLAGVWQLRRSMRPRNLSPRPGVHWGLGLDQYTQVTSPLRRYTDLLCHQQIRARLNGSPPLDEEEILLRAAAAEAAAAAASRAERASRAHWMAVYLSAKKEAADSETDSGEAIIWEAVVLDRRGNRGTVIIPALGLETQVSLRGTEEPNDAVRLKLISAKIPEGEANFSIA